MNPLVEELVAKYGEQNRKLIKDAIDFLERREPSWKLKTLIDRDLYIRNLVYKKPAT